MDEFLSFVGEQWVLFAALILILFLLARNLLSDSLGGVQQIDVNQAIRHINDEAIVLDVRLDNEFKSGHIKDAIHIPVGALETRFRELEKYKDKDIVVNCQSGNRSMRAIQILKKHGFEKVYNLSGGISAWNNANMPIETGTKSKNRKKKEKAA